MCQTKKSNSYTLLDRVSMINTILNCENTTIDLNTRKKLLVTIA